MSMCQKNENNPVLAGKTNYYGFAQADSVYMARGGISPCILAHLQGQVGHQVNILYEERVQSDRKPKPRVRDDREGV